MMEFSSPLAAMHPPPCPVWVNNRRDLPSSRSMYSSQAFGNNSFNFKDLSMKKTSSDYFTLKPARGSSPTSSLAADLSSNFHIDQRYAHSSATSLELYMITCACNNPYSCHAIYSPQIPTPRRSLFNANFLVPRDHHTGT